MTGKEHIEYEQFFTLALCTTALQPERTRKETSKRQIKIRYKETLLQPESGQRVEQPANRSCECRIGEQF